MRRLTIAMIFGGLLTIAVGAACALYSPVDYGGAAGAAPSDARELLRNHLGLELKRSVDPQDNWGTYRSIPDTSVSRQVQCVNWGRWHEMVTVSERHPDGRCTIDTVHVYRHGWPWHAFEGTNRFGDRYDPDGLHWAFVAPTWLRPTCHVMGYQPLMPSYAGQLGEEEILRLIAEIKSLGAKSPATNRDAKAGDQP